jgi:hypothetical protein
MPGVWLNVASLVGLVRITSGSVDVSAVPDRLEAHGIEAAAKAQTIPYIKLSIHLPRVDPTVWPLPASVVGHPRTAGCFSQVIRRYVRETRKLSLMEAVRRCSLLSAQVLEEAVPAMRSKGGCSRV